MKKHIGLKAKFTLVLTILCVSIVTAATIVGISIYRTSIIEHYNEFAYQIARSVADYFTDDELNRYVELAYGYNTGSVDESELNEVIESERYQNLHDLIDILRENTGANDIFVCTFNMDVLENYDEEADLRDEWNPLYYIMDNYHDPEGVLLLGDNSTIFPEYCEDIAKSYYSGVHADNMFVADGAFGYTTSAIFPIVRNGKVVAFSCVEVPMATLHDDVNNFIIKIVTAAVIVAIIILILEILILVRTMISPIKIVAAEAESFISNDNVISEKLKTIKTKDEIQILSESILKLELDINEYIEDLTTVTAEKERIGAELDVAKQIQADMLPNIFPAFPERKEFEIYASMTPAKEVGGDFYDFFLIDEDHLALVIADVSGKGVPAALFMVISKTLLKNQAQIGHSPKEILMKVNNQLCENNEAQMFVTVWLGILEISTGKLTAANAGHEYPAIKRANGQFEIYKDKHGFVLAGMEDVKYKEYEIELNEGDTLFVYTDGVAEATDSKNQLYGTERMIAALNKEQDASPEKLINNIADDIDMFVGEAEQFDDITMLSLRLNSRRV